MIDLRDTLGALLLSSLALTALSVPDLHQTFNAVDPESGEPVVCEYCPAGTFLRQSCTSTRPSVCERCPSGSFTEISNYIERCLRCSVCGRNMEVTSECSPNKDCRCQCKQGYYYKDRAGMCVRHRQCGTGSGVAVKGTPLQDTVCDVCSNGTFSDGLSSDGHCVPHSSCQAPGSKVVLRGSSWHDTVCSSCEESGTKDGADYLRQILPSFFSHYKLSLRRLRHVVSKLPSADGRPETRRSLSGLDQSRLQSRLHSWISNSSVRLLRKLPRILDETGAYYTSERLQNKLDQIDAALSRFCHTHSLDTV